MTALESVPELVGAAGGMTADGVRRVAAEAPLTGTGAARVRPLDPARYLRGRLEDALPALLLESAAPMSVDDLARAWCTADEIVDRSMPVNAVRSAIEGWSHRSGIVFDDGRIGLAHRSALPSPQPWTDAGMPWAVGAAPLARGVNPWPGDWGHLIGAVAAAVRPAAFRSMRIEAADHFGGVCTIDVAVVDLGRAVAALTTSQLVCSQRAVTSLERGQWWFWDAATTPLLDPSTRRYGAELVEGQMSRCVKAATTTRGTGEAVALLLLAANLDKNMTLTVSIDEGPRTLCALSAEEWAQTPPDGGVARCIACGRPLTDAESARRGFGAGCWERLGPQVQSELERLVLPLRWRGGSGWAYPLPVGAFDDVVSRG